MLAYHRLRLRGGVALDRAEFSLLLLDEFLRQVVEDESGLWDLWCNMALTGRLPDPPGSGSQGDIQAAEAVRGAFLPLLRDHDLGVERMTAQTSPCSSNTDSDFRNRHPSPPGGGIGFPALGRANDPPLLDYLPLESHGFRSRPPAPSRVPDDANPPSEVLESARMPKHSSIIEPERPMTLGTASAPARA